MNEFAKKLVNDIAAYMNPQGEETEHFEEWIGEAQPDLVLKSPSDTDSQTLDQLRQGEEVDEDDVIALALNNDLTKGAGDFHIFPKLIQLIDLVHRPQQ